jgi:hypothetical protein
MNTERLVFICFCLFYLFPFCASGNNIDTTQVSSRGDAIAFIEKYRQLAPSAHWPEINAELFLKNVKDNVYHPLDLYEGNNTNFCGYAAFSYLLLHDNPLGYARLMIDLYQNGKAQYGKIIFDPSPEIKNVAGRLRFKGRLDVRPAEQMWFLCLADHFKGYINFYNHDYDPGDENTFWAAVNYGKFNRMIRHMLNYKVTARGSDLLRPWIANLYEYIKPMMQTGTTILYLNNTNLYKKNHNKLRAAIPTHYVILLDFSQTPDGLISITYWDYGFRTLQQIKPSFLKKIIFGISHCTQKTAHE